MENKKLLIIFNKGSISGVIEAYKALQAEGIHVAYTTFDQSVFYLSEEASHIQFPGIQEDITSFDLVFVKSLDRKIYSAMLAVYPNLSLLQTSDKLSQVHKLIQYAGFAGAKLSFPRTIFMNHADTTLGLHTLKEHFTYPIVGKEIDHITAHGNGVHLFENEESLHTFLKENTCKIKWLLFQEYIPNEYDIRILVLGGKPAFAFKKIRNQQTAEWRNNVALGATKIDVPIDAVEPEIKELAVKAAQAINLTIAGVDIMVDTRTHKPYILEVNSGPEFIPGTSEAIVRFTKERLAAS